METKPTYTKFDEQQEDRIYSVSPRDLGLVPADERRFGMYLTRGEFFFSPFREEKSPSLHISPSKKHAGWDAFDFSERQGYTAVSLVVRLLGFTDEYVELSSGKTFLKSASHRAKEYIWYDILQEGMAISSAPVAKATVRAENKIVIDSFGPVNNKVIIDYCLSRGLYKHHICRDFEQAKFHFSATPNRYIYALAQRNSENGVILRLAREDVAYKKLNVGSSAPTYRGVGGDYVLEPTSSLVLVLEGMLEYPSWQRMTNHTKPFRDVCILNSVSNVEKAKSFIMAHQEVDCCLNLDKAGKDATEQIRRWCNEVGVRFTDSSVRLGEHNDLNDLLKTIVRVDLKPKGPHR